MITYYSTRDENAKNGVSSATAIKRGIAPDGGLYSPDVIPVVSPDFIESLKDLDYSARAANRSPICSANSATNPTPSITIPPRFIPGTTPTLRSDSIRLRRRSI